MKYMLDTNICIHILNYQDEYYLKNLQTLDRKHSISISSIVLAELQYGIANSIRQKENQLNVNTLLTKLEVLDFSAKCAMYYGEIRADLKSKGMLIGNNDLFIASHALAENAVLVTNNTSEFKRVKGLKIVSWTY